MLQNKILVDVQFYYLDNNYNVYIHLPAGADSFFVYINSLFVGKIVNTSIGWRPYVNTSILSGNDIGEVIEMIKVQQRS